MSGKWAPDNAEGLHAYVVTQKQFARKWERIEYARDLYDAKSRFGHTRASYTTVKVRRATLADVAIPDGAS